MLHESHVLRRLLVNTTWSEKRAIEDLEENSTIFYPMLDLNIQNRAILPCNLQHKTGKRRGEENFAKFKLEFLNRGAVRGFLVIRDNEKLKPVDCELYACRDTWNK